jgi:hypothetical protein
VNVFYFFVENNNNACTDALFDRYAAASVVIGTGAYIGKMSPDQILVIGFIQAGVPTA